MKNSNYYKFIILFLISFLIINQGESQVLISTGTGETPDASAMLEIKSTTSGSCLLTALIMSACKFDLLVSQLWNEKTQYNAQPIARIEMYVSLLLIFTE